MLDAIAAAVTLTLTLTPTLTLTLSRYVDVEGAYWARSDLDMQVVSVR